MTKKKFILSLTVVFFALLLLFTFISKSVYNAPLPVVTTAKAVKGSISQTKTLEGEFSYSDASKVTARDNRWTREPRCLPSTFPTTGSRGRTTPTAC